MVTMLKRALPAAAITAVLACAPAAMAATVSSGNPLTLNGQADVQQDWSLDDGAAPGTVTAYLYEDPVVYDDQAPLPANCADYDSGAADTGTPGPDLTADPSGDGTAHILLCTGVTSVVVSSGDSGSSVNGRGLSEIPLTFNGGNGDDYVYGSAVGDVINGGGGSDTLRAQTGDDTVNGGAGDDNEVVGGPGVDIVGGGDGNDWMKGGPDNDTLSGGAGDDTIWGDCAGCETDDQYGNDTIDGGDGSDYAYGEGGNDVVNGGAGNDGDLSADDTSILSSSPAVPALSGGDGDDIVTGGEGDDVLLNDAGADTLKGDAGSDYFVEGFLFGQTSDVSADSIEGGDGVDSFQYWTMSNGIFGPGPVGAPQPPYTLAMTATLDGQANDNIVDDNPETPDDNGNNFDVENVQVIDTLFPFPSYWFAPMGSNVTGNDSANVIVTGHLADTVVGGNGPDRIETNNGDDTINTRDGYPDSVDCGEGTDTVTGDVYDTYLSCENVDSADVRSAYDKDEPPVIPPAPQIVMPPADDKGPGTTLTTRTRLNSDQLLNGVTLSVGCDEDCTIEGRLLGSQPVGSVHSSATRGFNVVLGRKSAGFGKGTRKLTVKPCVRKSKKAAAACRNRLRNQWERKRSFTVKVQTTTRDRAGNSTRVTKLIKVAVKKHKKAGR